MTRSELHQKVVADAQHRIKDTVRHPVMSKAMAGTKRWHQIGVGVEIPVWRLMSLRVRPQIIGQLIQ